MTKKNGDDVKVVAEVSKECKKQLRIIAIQKEQTLPQVVKDILERSVSKKIKESDLSNVVEIANSG